MDLVNCDAILGATLFVIFWGGTLGEFWDMIIFLDAFDLDNLGTFQSCLNSAASSWIGAKIREQMLVPDLHVCI